MTAVMALWFTDPLVGESGSQEISVLLGIVSVVFFGILPLL